MTPWVVCPVPRTHCSCAATSPTIGRGEQPRKRPSLRNGDGFRAFVEVIDEPQFADSTWQALRQEARALKEHAAVLFVVDGPALVDDHPILVVDLSDESRAAFRCVAHELWSVDNNLNLANMDWDEFAATSTGVLPGLPVVTHDMRQVRTLEAPVTGRAFTRHSADSSCVRSPWITWRKYVRLCRVAHQGGPRVP